MISDIQVTSFFSFLNCFLSVFALFHITFLKIGYIGVLSRNTILLARIVSCVRSTIKAHAALNA